MHLYTHIPTWTFNRYKNYCINWLLGNFPLKRALYHEMCQLVLNEQTEQKHMKHILACPSCGHSGPG